MKRYPPEGDVTTKEYAFALVEHHQWIDSLPHDDRRRQLYYSEVTPWQIFMGRLGWVNGGPCDAESAAFKTGNPIRLGDWEESHPDWLFEDEIGFSMQEGAKRNCHDFEPDPNIRDSF